MLLDRGAKIEAIDEVKANSNMSVVYEIALYELRSYASPKLRQIGQSDFLTMTNS
jgi:hypothetical protein